MLNNDVTMNQTAKAEILNVGLNVKAVRVLQDLTQGDLAKKAGVSVYFVNRLERGANDTNPSVGHLSLLSQALKVELKFLFEKPKKRRLFFAKIIDS